MDWWFPLQAMALTAIALVVGAFAFLHLAGPLLVWRKHRMEARVEFAPAVPEAAIAAAPAEFQRANGSLQQLGFRHVAATLYRAFGSESTIVLYRREDDPVVAVLHWARSGAEAMVVAEFDQRFADGSRASLGNGALPSMLPRPAGDRAWHLSGVEDMAELWQRFRRLRDRLDAAPIAPDPGTELAEFEEDFNAHLRFLRERGFYSAPDANGHATMSLPSAFRMSWRLLWPWKPLLLARERRRALRMTDPEPA
jgi:hypothetical protein